MIDTAWLTWFDMAGHGFYVWSSYGITALSLLLLIMGSRWHHRRWLRVQQRRGQRVPSSQPPTHTLS